MERGTGKGFSISSKAASMKDNGSTTKCTARVDYTTPTERWHMKVDGNLANFQEWAKSTMMSPGYQMKPLISPI